MINGKVFSQKVIKEKLVNYCLYQERCHSEVENKLWEFSLSDENKDDIILFLIENNFLNEERFVKHFSYGKFYLKKWGKIKIKNELKKRNINDRLINIGLNEINDDDYLQVINELIEKKKSNLAIENLWLKNKKIYNYLISKGYESEIIKNLLDLNN